MSSSDSALPAAEQAPSGGSTSGPRPATREDLSLAGVDAIASLLREKYPDINPLAVRSDQLADFVAALEVPAILRPVVVGADAALLESLQLAWLEEVHDFLGRRI